MCVLASLLGRVNVFLASAYMHSFFLPLSLCFSLPFFALKGLPVVCVCFPFCSFRLYMPSPLAGPVSARGGLQLQLTNYSACG